MTPPRVSDETIAEMKRDWGSHAEVNRNALVYDLSDARATIAAQAKVIEAADRMRRECDASKEHYPHDIEPECNFCAALKAYDAARAGGQGDGR